MKNKENKLNKKDQLVSFLYKYYLDGIIDKTVIEVKENSLRTQGYNSEQQVFCDISMVGVDIFDEKNINLVVTNTESLFSLLKAFKDPDIDVYFNESNGNNNPHSIMFHEGKVDSNFLLSIDGVISPHGKDINPDVESYFDLEVTDEVYEKFNRYKYLLKDETRSFSFFVRDNSVHMLFGLNRYAGSNNISIDLEIEPNIEFRNEIIFPIDPFYSMIRQNEGQYTTVKVLNNAMIVKSKGGMFDNIYAMPTLKNKETT